MDCRTAVKGAPSKRLKTQLAIPLMMIIIPALSACDYYVENINENWSLCAVDNKDDMTLCLKSGDSSYTVVLEPTMVAFGYNGSVISLKRCFDRNEEYYSVDATHTGVLIDPPYTGPLNRAEWEAALVDDPENWPAFSHHETWLAKKHCPETE